MKRNKKRISYVLVPTVFTVIMAIIFGMGLLPFLKAGSAQWRTVWIMNAPEYSYEQMNRKSSSDTGTIQKNKAHMTAGTQYGEISCDKWDARVPLYYGDKKEFLELGAGTYVGYGLPGDGERILIGGHDTTYFSVLEEIEEGNIIAIETLWGNFDYEVDRIEIADADQILSDIEEAEQEELILYTCYPFGEIEKVRGQRYIVYAHLQSEKVE